LIISGEKVPYQYGVKTTVWSYRPVRNYSPKKIQTEPVKKISWKIN
jgi:hypothetical protein